MSHNIYHNFYINVTPEIVFNAISKPEHLDNWWTFKSSGIPELGSEYNLNFTDEYDWYCKVSEVKLGESFFLKMTKADEDWNPTTFGFKLESKDEGTLVRFSHENWKANNDHFKKTSFCWAMLLNGLKNYLEKGIVVPFNERS